MVIQVVVSGAAGAKYRLVRELPVGKRGMKVVGIIVWEEDRCRGGGYPDGAIDQWVGIGGNGEGWETGSRGVISTRPRG